MSDDPALNEFELDLEDFFDVHIGSLLKLGPLEKASIRLVMVKWGGRSFLKGFHAGLAESKVYYNKRLLNQYQVYQKEKQLNHGV